MFRVEERNGNSFVYDGDTGSLVMIIKSNNKENSVKDEQITVSDGKKGQLLPNSSSKPAVVKFCPSVKLPKVTYCNDDSDDVLSESEFKKKFNLQENKELYAPVYNQNSFLEIFHLKPTSSADTVKVPTFPDGEDDNDSSEKSFEGQKPLSRSAHTDFDFSSVLGQSILQKKRNWSVCMRDAALSVAKYDKYCVQTKKNLNDGLLRDRQGNLVFQVSYVPRTRASGHKYVFNKRQRLERLKIIKTGLNRRARHLKQLCKDVEVQLDRLSEEDIKRWTTHAPHSSTSMQPCIDGTIVIQIDDSDDEEVTVSPKPMLKSDGLCHTVHWDNVRRTFVPVPVSAPVVNSTHPIFTNGLTHQCLSQLSISLVPANPLALQSSGGFKDTNVDVFRPLSSRASSSSDSEASDSGDSEIKFLGCVPHPRSTVADASDQISGPCEDKVPRFLVTNLCQPTLGVQANSPGRVSITPALQLVAVNGNCHMSSLNRRKLSSPGTQKMPVSPFPTRSRFKPQIIARNLDERLAKARSVSANRINDVALRSICKRGILPTHTSNETINSDFGKLETDVEQVLGRLNRLFIQRQSVSSSLLPEVRELVVKFQCHLCGFEEKHYHSAAKRMARHMEKYHGEVDGAVRLLVNVEAPRGEPHLIVVQAVSAEARARDHMASSNFIIVNL